eukprot:4854414-Amphidinium_carterae.1
MHVFLPRVLDVLERALEVSVSSVAALFQKFVGTRSVLQCRNSVLASINKVAGVIGWKGHAGGHTFRVITGAQFLAHMGIKVATIVLLARWRSETVLRYVREAPLSSLTTLVANKFNLQTQISQSDLDKLEKQLRDKIEADLSVAVRQVTENIQEVRDTVHRWQEVHREYFVTLSFRQLSSMSRSRWTWGPCLRVGALFVAGGSLSPHLVLKKSPLKDDGLCRMQWWD